MTCSGRSLFHNNDTSIEARHVVDTGGTPEPKKYVENLAFLEYNRYDTVI